MGIEVIKDEQGKEQYALNSEDFYNEDILGDKFEDYEILQVISKYPFIAKVKSKFNLNIYTLEKINSKNIKTIININHEFETYKNLDNPNIIKYYKFFEQNNNSYFIYEYIDNCNLNELIEAYVKSSKHIEADLLWNIFMQCISALKYIHSKNITHKNITLENIYMNENKIVKLGGFKFPFINEDKSKLLYNNNNSIYYLRKLDIEAMGKVFNELLKIALNKEKQKEMEYIINLMINENENENGKNEDNIYNCIMEEYIKNSAKISSINSIFRCLNSFDNFTSTIFQNSQFILNNETKKPASFYLLKCMQNYLKCNNENPKDNAIFLYSFKKLLHNNNLIYNEKEINVFTVLEFLLEQLNKENGLNTNFKPFNTIPINFNKNEKEAFDDLFNYYNYKSIITQNFTGIIKTKRICKLCNEILYSFYLFPFIEFDLEICQNDLNISNWFHGQNQNEAFLTRNYKIICQNCGKIGEFKEYKQFYSFPKNLIIVLNRGDDFNNEAIIKYPETLNLDNEVEKQKFTKFKLVGIIKRVFDEHIGEKYISIYLSHNQNQKNWVVSDINQLYYINNPFEYNNGMVMILFYSAENNV